MLALAVYPPDTCDLYMIAFFVARMKPRSGEIRERRSRIPLRSMRATIDEFPADARVPSFHSRRRRTRGRAAASCAGGTRADAGAVRPSDGVVPAQHARAHARARPPGA